MSNLETVLAYEAGVRDGLAQARKRDTMLDDMCNLIDERDILLAEKALLESERDELKEEVGKLQIRVHNDMGKCVELEADLNELTFDQDTLKAKVAELELDLAKMAERLYDLQCERHFLLTQRDDLRAQNALLVEALEQIDNAVILTPDGAKVSPRSAIENQRIAREALAAVKEEK